MIVIHLVNEIIWIFTSKLQHYLFHNIFVSVNPNFTCNVEQHTFRKYAKSWSWTNTIIKFSTYFGPHLGPIFHSFPIDADPLGKYKHTIPTDHFITLGRNAFPPVKCGFSFVPSFFWTNNPVPRGQRSMAGRLLRAFDCAVLFTCWHATCEFQLCCTQVGQFNITLFASCWRKIEGKSGLHFWNFVATALDCSKVFWVCFIYFKLDF